MNRVFFYIYIMMIVFQAGPRAWGRTIGSEEFRKKPKLVLVLAVDQFRADYLTRFESRFLPARQGATVGGYRYLVDQGAYYPFAQYDVLQCMTGPGHAMILSGTYPYQMGIPLNSWFDRIENKPQYCVEDKAQEIVGTDGVISGVPGLSPKNMSAETVGDVLKTAGYPSRVVSIALKDRAAILLGGHRADLALWMDPLTFQWVSSRFYLPDGKLPEWVKALDLDLSRRRGASYLWKSSAKNTGLTLGQPFTHSAAIGSKEALSLPLGLELTVQAAERAMESFKLGRGPSVDLLALSFSSHDYLGHLYGPNTLEMEEMTVAEDRQISRLLNSLRTKLPGGLRDVLIVLTADHGIPPSPSWLKSQRVDAGKMNPDEVIERMDARLTERFGKPQGGKWFSFHADLNFYFAREALAGLEKSKILEETVFEAAKTELEKTPGMAFVFSRYDYRRRTLPPGMFERSILKTYVPGRSGDLILIPRPFYMVDDDPVSHMTRYSYDRTVPLIFAGPRIKPGVHAEAADVVDIATTLSFILGTLAPAGAEGRVLGEMF